MFQQDRPKSFMQELDKWTNDNIISPLDAAFGTDNQTAYEDAVATVTKAIREKVLESYHNGQAAGPSKGRRNDTR